MKRSLITLTIISVFLAMYLIGCGGGDGVSGINSLPSNNSDGTGTLTVSINWPELEQGMDASVLQPSVTKIRVEVTPASGSVLTTEIKRTAGSKTETGKIDNVPVGKATLNFQGMDAAGNIMSSRIRKDFDVVAGPNNVTADLGVSIVGGKFIPNTIKIQPNDTLYWGNTDTTTWYIKFTQNDRDFTLVLAPGELKEAPMNDVDLSRPVSVYLFDNPSYSGAPKDQGLLQISTTSGSEVYTELPPVWGRTQALPHNAVDGHTFVAVDQTGNFYVAMYKPAIPAANKNTGNPTELEIPLTVYENRLEKYDSAGIRQKLDFNVSDVHQIVGIAVDRQGTYLYLADNRGVNSTPSEDTYTNNTDDRVLRYNAQSGGYYHEQIIVPNANYIDKFGALRFDGHFPQGLAVSPDGAYLFICDAHYLTPADTTSQFGTPLLNIYAPLLHRVNLKESDPITGTNYTWAVTGGITGTKWGGYPYSTAYNRNGVPTEFVAANVIFNATTHVYIPTDVTVSGDQQTSTSGTVYISTWGDTVVQTIGVGEGQTTQVTDLDFGVNTITGLDIRWASSSTTASEVFAADMATSTVYRWNGANVEALPLDYNFITGWPGPLNSVRDAGEEERGGGLFGLAVAPNNAGQLYTADDFHRITQFKRSSSDSLGTYSLDKAWRLLYDAFNYPTGIAYDNGNVYVTDRINCRVLKYNADFAYERQWGIPPDPQRAPTPEWYQCLGWALYDQDSGGTGVQPTRYIFSEAVYSIPIVGAIVNAIDPLQTNSGGVEPITTQLPRCAAGEFFMPQGIAVSGGFVYVVDWARNPNEARKFGRIQKFTTDGVFVQEWYKSPNLGNFVAPKGIAVSRGFIYLTWLCGTSGMAERFREDGTASGQAYTSAPVNLAVNRPEGIVVDTSADTLAQYPDGVLYVSDKYNHRICIYNPVGGDVLGQVAPSAPNGGVDVGQVKYPTGLAVDSIGNLFCTDSGNKRMQKWSSFLTGNKNLAAWPVGSQTLDLDAWGCAVSPDSNYVFTADKNAHRIVKFKKAD